MRGGPGRVLPSLIIGGLLVGGLALGMGTASAVPCTQGEKTYEIGSSADVVRSSTGACELTTEGLAKGLAAALGSLTPVPADPTSSTPGDTNLPSNPSDLPPVVTSPIPGPTPGTGVKPPKQHGRPRPSATTPYVGKTRTQNGSAATLPPAALPAAAVVPPPAALPGLPLAPGLGAPALAGVFAPSALGGGSLPGGLSSSLFGANFGNPALLAGTPLGAAAASLYQPQADSAVTTVSHSEALAAGAPRGIGTPTAIAAIALACVVGLVVRRGVLGRITRHETAAGALDGDPVEAGPGRLHSVTSDDLVIADEPLLAA
jgi:hypothetical protein